MTDPNKKNTILFVDDEPSIVEVASTFFKVKGYHVLTAGNGKEALDILAQHTVDCCFTDINMPEMDGLALTEHIRKHDNTLPVIVMTGYPSLDNTIHILKNGVVDFLIKPVNLSQMEVCVQRVLRERNLFIQNLMLKKELKAKAKLEKINSEMRLKIEELNILNKILNDFNSLRESNDVFKQLVTTATEIAQADVCHFYLIPESSQLAAMSIAQASRTSENTLLIASSPAEMETWTDPLRGESALQVHALLEEVARDDRPLLLANNTNGHRRLPDNILSYMLVPFKIRDKTLGFLSAALHCGARRFTEKDLYYLAFMTTKAQVAIENLALYENIYNNLLATLYAFVKAIEARDPYTKKHSNRVTHLAVLMAKAMGCSDEELQILHVAGLLHDIGKIGIRDDILLKPSRLSPEEYNIIKQHPVIGSEIMDNVGLWTREKQIVRSHHERFDGLGYPDQLAGTQIPVLARILSVADVYDAIASDRAYRLRMDENKILEIMYQGSGSQFDPDIMKIFRELYEAGKVAEAIKDDE